MANENTKIITLICERAADIDGIMDDKGHCKTVDGVSFVKLPCSGMIQANMVDHALKSGAAGVIVCGCQIGDCYYREGNKHIRERLLGERTPTLKKNVDRRRILALWLSRLQTDRFVSEAKEFVGYVKGLGPAEAAGKPAAAPAAAKPAPAPPAESGKGEGSAQATPPATPENKGVEIKASDATKAEDKPAAG
ncbi:MAG TPA: hydrogenase iron-sulfur subunit [Chroococcales cyanobacterium]